MRVTHVIAPIMFGGGESLLVNLLRERRDGIDEFVVSIYTSNLFNKELDSIGIPHWELRQDTLGQGISKLKIGLGTLRTLFKLPKLVSILKDQKIDIIHAHGYPASLLCGLCSMIGHRKLIYTHHFYRMKPKFIEREVLSFIYRRFEVCTGVSEVVTKSMCEAFPKVASRFETLHNCVGTPFFNINLNTSSERKISSSRKKFIQIARFSSFKNQALVVESLRRLPEEILGELEIIFIGDGVERPYVQRLAERLEVTSSVRFLGTVPYKDIPELLANADYGLFPSAQEGFGIGAAECLAAGLPVLCLKNDLMKEIVGDAGILVEKSELAQGLVRMMVVGDSLRERATVKAAKYLPASIKDKYCRIYKKLK